MFRLFIQVFYSFVYHGDNVITYLLRLPKFSEGP